MHTMDQIQQIYNQFLALFPHILRPFISIAVALLLIYAIFQTLRRNFIYIIVLIILLPASIPILRNVADGLIGFIKQLF